MKFTGVFNYQRGINTMTTEAGTERQAWLFFCHGLAMQHSVSDRTMRNYFNGNKLNYMIREEKS